MQFIKSTKMELISGIEGNGRSEEYCYLKRTLKETQKHLKSKRRRSASLKASCNFFSFFFIPGVSERTVSAHQLVSLYNVGQGMCPG